MSTRSAAADERGWRREAEVFTRAAAGAMLFGVPLIYTQEMWDIAQWIDRWRLLVALALAFLVNIALSHFSGFKDEPHTLREDLEEALEALAVGAVVSTVLLFALNRLSPGDPLDQIAATIAMQTVPLSIGAAIANAFIVDKAKENNAPGEGTDPWRATALDFAATAFGALFISYNIAPTEEVQLLAYELTLVHKLAIVAISLAIAYAIVFESKFGAHEKRHAQPGIFQRPLTETAAAYVVALAVTFVVLTLVGKVNLDDPLSAIIAQTLVLGLPASIGGAAGRLVV